ncbi:MAG: HEAT repeat domain-containing protein [Verrucomicrobia bacterium]|nr:HEAT repeat domain-containing protein [Verrucomicrobiota bacterium]
MPLTYDMIAGYVGGIVEKLRTDAAFSFTERLQAEDCLRHYANGFSSGTEGVKLIEHLVECLLDASLTPDQRRLQFISPLVTCLQEGQRKHNRCAAAQLLGWLGDVRAVGPLTDALKDQNEDVRCAAAEALKEIINTNVSNEAQDKGPTQ